MAAKIAIARLFARLVNKKQQWWIKHGVLAQQQTLQSLLRRGKRTAFGRDHNFDGICSYDDFKANVPLRDYEQLSPYIKRVKKGEPDILWPGRPAYLAKTSGTTSGVKYIPLTRASLKEQVKAARNALLTYIYQTGNAEFLRGKMMFIQGSPALEKLNGISVGRLSGIVAHYVPRYLQRSRLPKMSTNMIAGWEEKVDQIVLETRNADMRLLSGIPPWVQMYCDKLLKSTGAGSVKEIFPNMQLFVYGGVNYKPYRNALEKTFGEHVDSIQTYPASEGFIAYQDLQGHEDMLLLLDAGIFYEFVEADQLGASAARRHNIGEVKAGVNYAIILSTNAGLWGYVIGDTVMFTSLMPYRIKVTGRTSHYTSAFGEHVIASEVEDALGRAASQMGLTINEFHVAPQVNPPDGGKPYHEWFVEGNFKMHELTAFGEICDGYMRENNIYYNDLIKGNVLRPLVVRKLPAGTFLSIFKLNGTVDAQLKVKRVANDRKLADQLEPLIEQ